MSTKFIFMLDNNTRHNLQCTTIEAASRTFHNLSPETQQTLSQGQLYKVTPKGSWISAKILTPEELAQKKIPKKKPDIAYFDAKASVDSIEWCGIASALRTGMTLSKKDKERYTKAKEALNAATVEFLEKNISKILQPFME